MALRPSQLETLTYILVRECFEIYLPLSCEEAGFYHVDFNLQQLSASIPFPEASCFIWMQSARPPLLFDPIPGTEAAKQSTLHMSVAEQGKPTEGQTLGW